jgi:hypothetical protein
MRILIASAFLLLACSFVLVTAENIATLRPPGGEEQPEYLPAPEKPKPDPRTIRARVLPPVQNPVDMGHLLPDNGKVFFGPNVIESQADKFPLPDEEVIDSQEDPNPPQGRPNSDGIVEEEIIEQEKADMKEQVKAVPVVKPDGSVGKVLVKEPVIKSPIKQDRRPAPVVVVPEPEPEEEDEEEEDQPEDPAPYQFRQGDVAPGNNKTKNNDTLPTTPAKKKDEPLSPLVIVLIVLGVLVLVIGIGAVVFFLIRKKKKEQEVAAAAAAGAGGASGAAESGAATGSSDAATSGTSA